MTLPTLTYGQAWQTDCDDITNWTEHEDGNTATLTVLSGTIFQIDVTVSAGNKSVYYDYDFTDISSTLAGKFKALYKTSDSSIKAKITGILTATGEEVWLAETSNTEWTEVNADITGSDTIEKIRIYATQATGQVYFDFLMIFKGTFTIPYFKNITYSYPVKTVKIPIPGRDTDILQHLGRGNAEFTIEGTMQSGSDETWGGSNLTYGEYLYHALRERYFQWLTTDQGNYKVMVDPNGFRFAQDADSGQQLTYSLKLLEYDVGDRSSSHFDDPAWYGM